MFAIWFYHKTILNSVQFFYLIIKDNFMAKIWLIVLFSCFSSLAAADEYGKFYEDVLISNDVKLEENAETAKHNASSLLDKKAPVIKIDGQASLPFRSQRPRGETNNRSESMPFGFGQNKPVIVEKTATKYGEGPFGLSWGGTYNQIKAMGVELQKVDIKDYVNSFAASQLPKPLPDFDKVVISFGEDNLMWRVLAYGKKLDDDADAAKVLKLYRKYYKLLNQKYGNAKEFFTPKITVIEKTVKDQFGRDQIETTKIKEPLGGKNFLAELQSGEAVLYATFEDLKVGAALAVNVDGDGKSYLILDFTNLQIYKEREEQTLNAL